MICTVYIYICMQGTQKPQSRLLKRLKEIGRLTKNKHILVEQLLNNGLFTRPNIMS